MTWHHWCELDNGKSYITSSRPSMYGKNWLRYSLICFRWRRKKTPQTTARMIKINRTPPTTPMAIMISCFSPCEGGSDASDTERNKNNFYCCLMLLQLRTDHLVLLPPKNSSTAKTAGKKTENSCEGNQRKNLGQILSTTLGRVVQSLIKLI